MKSARFQHFASCRPIGVRILTRTSVVAILVSLLMGVGARGNALAEEGGDFTLQCFCPLEWSETWDGAGVFNEAESLDTVALTSGGAVLLIHEIPLDTGTLGGMIEERTESLEQGTTISDLAETWEDETGEDAISGRIWVNADGETMYGFQYVQVWETNFLLSIEFVAPEDEFVESWDSLEFVLLIGSPILGEFSGVDIAAEIAA
jgi:hypothetical protein